MARSGFLILVAVVMFIVAAVLVLAGSVDHKIIDVLSYGGLASFAAAHFPGG